MKALKKFLPNFLPSSHHWTWRRPETIVHSRQSRDRGQEISSLSASGPFYSHRNQRWGRLTEVLSVRPNFMSVPNSDCDLISVNRFCNAPLTLLSVFFFRIWASGPSFEDSSRHIGARSLGHIVPSEPFGERLLQRSRFLWRFCVKSVSVWRKRIVYDKFYFES